jgi:cytochrome c553
MEHCKIRRFGSPSRSSRAARQRVFRLPNLQHPSGTFDMKTPVAFALTAVFAALLAAPVYAAEAAAAPVKADPAKGEELSKNVCSACHTNDGSRGISTNPILQGQHADYIVKQLTEFKAGKRKNAVMNGMAAPLSDADMHNVAAFYASKAPVTGAAKNKDTVLLGEKIYRGGIAEKHIPACAGCHSPNGAGIPAQYPRLAGQHSDYVEAQLNAFRAGERTNSAQMTTIAANLSDKEVKAVADYVMGLR